MSSAHRARVETHPESSHGREDARTAWVYLLRCSDDSYYSGSTRSLEHRMAQHHVGEGAEYTRQRLPVELVWAHECERVDDAYALEKRIQGWSRAKREALIRGEFEQLPGLSRSSHRR